MSAGIYLHAAIGDAIGIFLR
uniref:Uncharacterized protein n=1 Tax=Lepeophtheirus salmonis TaxID=72036 RepID=A0A0K2UQZ7_LEPSM